MNFDKYIVDYLQQQKQFSLAGIGEFSLLENSNASGDQTHQSNSSVLFAFNTKAITSNDFLSYLASLIKKPTSVINADYEDYVLQLKSWLNTGKTIQIVGLGSLKRNSNTGIISLSDGEIIKEKIAANTLDTSNGQSENRTTTKPKLDKKKLTNFIVALGLTGTVLCLAWAFYTGLIKFPKTESEKQVLANTPTIPTQQKNADTIVAKKDTIAPLKDSIVLYTTDTVRYKVIFYTTKYKDKAIARLKQFDAAEKINYDSAVLHDTLRYRLFIYRKALQVDTNKVKVFFEKYFKHSVYLQPAK